MVQLTLSKEKSDVLHAPSAGGPQLIYSSASQVSRHVLAAHRLQHAVMPILQGQFVAAGPSADSKKHKPGLDLAPDTAYNLAEAQELPSWITERVRTCQRLPSSEAPAQGSQQQPSSSGPDSDPANSLKPEFVLYWMRTAIRGHENPALDVAKHEAKQQGLPLLVAAFVLTSHPYPTARRFKFWLEGLRDTQRELRAQARPL